MKKRILALILAVTAVFNVCPIYAEEAVTEEIEENISETETDVLTVTEENTVSGLVKLTCDSTDDSNIVIGGGEKAYIYANLDSSIDHIGIFRWQLRTPSGNWATVRDYVLPYAVVSEALVAGTLDENGNAYLRCLAVDGETKYVSGIFKITLNSNVEPLNLNLLPPVAESVEQETQPDAEQTELLVADSEATFGLLNARADAPAMVLLSETEPETTVVPEETATAPEETATVSEDSEPAEEPEEIVVEDEQEASPEESEAVEDALTESVEVLSDPEETTAESQQPSTPSVEAFHIVVNYTFRHASQAPLIQVDGTPAANTFTVSLPTGGHYSGTVASPPEVGYLPYVLAEDAEYVTGLTAETPRITYDSKEYVLAYSVEFKEVSSEKTVNVYYIPQQVNFQVRIYEQNLYNDEYSLVETKIISDRLANEIVGEDHDAPRTGFSPLYYDPNLPISEDGTTVVEIYYDRNYYLVEFELYHESHGVDGFGAADFANAFGAPPCMVRYNSQVIMPLPTNTGFEFVNWRLREVYLTETVIVDDEETTQKIVVNDHNYSATQESGDFVVAKHNIVYCADWVKANTTYEFVYWLENADSDDSANKENYDVWYIQSVNAQTGDKTAAISDIKNVVTVGNGYTQLEVNDVTSTRPYLTLNDTLTEKDPKTVIGNGTTTVNIYYSRIEYTLKFYYAIEKTAGTYHVIGGSTYYFGGNASGSAQTDEILAMRQYASGNQRGNTGQVTALPTLNEKGIGRNYTVSHDVDTSTNNKYHYISFKAKYGADISNLWPCDVFNSVERSSANTHGQWSGMQAFVSAWNGEYRVRYTRDSNINNGNQTIKGNYTQLDANLLWNDTSITDTTVAYACFWENGANINWSVPELYRYNIYLPVLDGETPTTETKEYNGVTYYLADQYNTCDDSSVHSQTQPGLVGFTPAGRQSQTIADFDKTLYKEAYDMFFYYSRNLYNLTFDDMHGSTLTFSLPYGYYIHNPNDDSSLHDHAPDYPDDLEEGECEFVDWYLDELCQYHFDHDIRMPAKNIQVYAKWKTLEYTARVFLQKDDIANNVAPIHTETVEFDNFIKEPNYRDYQKDDEAGESAEGEESTDGSDGIDGNNPYKNRLFAGWYYMDGNEEKRFDFNTMTLKENLDIYAKWTSRIPVKYNVYYVINVDGNNVEIAEATSGQSLAGMIKSFIAKVGDELDAGYREGYYPEMRAHTMIMDEDDDKNIYYFVYSYVTDKDIDYTVTHEFTSDEFKSTVLGVDHLHEVFHYQISGDHAKERAASMLVSFREGITRDAIGKAAYNQINAEGAAEPAMDTLAAVGITRDAVALAAEAQAGVQLTDAQIDAVWNVVKKLSPNFYEQNLVLTTAQDNNVTFEWKNLDQTAYYQVIHYQQSVDGLEYIVKSSTSIVGNINTTVSAGKYDELQKLYTGFELVTPEEDISGIVKSVEVADDGTLTEGLVLRLYYDRISYDYEIHFVERTTNKKLEEPVSGSALFGTVIKLSDVAKDIEGYILAESDATATIGVSDSTQIINCEYKGLTVYYRYQILGGIGGTLSINGDSAAVGTSPEKAVVLTVNTGFYLEGWKYSVGEGELQPVPDEWLSDDKMTLKVTDTRADWVGEMIYVYAELLPTTRTFEVTGSDSSEQKGVHSFLFNIKGKAETDTEDIDLTFIIVGNGSIKLERLPYGEYTITPLGWAWRYGMPRVYVGENNIDLVDGKANVTFSNADNVVFQYTEATKTYWLTDSDLRELHLAH